MILPHTPLPKKKIKKIDGGGGRYVDQKEIIKFLEVLQQQKKKSREIKIFLSLKKTKGINKVTYPYSVSMYE